MKCERTIVASAARAAASTVAARSRRDASAGSTDQAIPAASSSRTHGRPATASGMRQCGASPSRSRAAAATPVMAGTKLPG